MNASAWIYNYDFELEWAGQAPIVFGNKQVVPWWFLNRSAHFLMPLAKEKDLILCYQEPDQTIIDQLKPALKRLPRFFPVRTIDGESNSIVRDVKAMLERENVLENYRLEAWGWNQGAIDLANRYFHQSISSDLADIVRTANSKSTSDWIRSGVLGGLLAIPSCHITDRHLTVETLKNQINGFISQYSPVIIKNYFGTSGRLSRTVDAPVSSRRQLERWMSWIRTNGGILLEKRLDSIQEFSVQATIDSSGTVELITTLTMYSNQQGSYLGNVIDRNQADQPPLPEEQLLPLLSDLKTTGYFGPIGLDFLITPDQEIKLIEINARLTMGRIAHAWNQVLNPYRFGLFINAFTQEATFDSSAALIDFCADLEKNCDGTVFVINFLKTRTQPLSLITILIGANTKNLLFQLAGRIISSLNQIDIKQTPAM